MDKLSERLEALREQVSVDRLDVDIAAHGGLLATLREAAAIVRAWEGAEVAEVRGHDEVGDDLPLVYLPLGFKPGQRVRLVPEAGR